MTQFLLDTLTWTGLLIALVLVLRRPVARKFGPQAAYALWLLPFLRLIMPPITLPAWLNPAPSAPQLAAIPEEFPAALAMGPVARASEASVPVTMPSPVDFVTPLVILWLVGAAVFLVRRFSLYFKMRRELLENARPVGEVGRVRFVETAEADGPVAFGVLDKVIALPDGFMASRDRATRDLALEHELAHHRGHDLIANFLVQPLFALHWFNPLAIAGWRAMRRDQEAACDARVVARRPREQRAAYAGIIADFATHARSGNRHALAAPMACPVLGDKSIIHRLRSLTMNDISPRRRFAGRALLAGAALVLPLTASISYAAEEAPPAPPTPPSAPTAPTAPSAPLPPEAPMAPEAPDAPLPPSAAEFDAQFDDMDVDVDAERIERDAERSERDAERAERAAERAERNMERRVEIIERRAERAAEKGKRVERRVVRVSPHGMSAEERAELRADMEELRATFAENGEFQRELRLAVAEAKNAAPEVVVECRDGQREVAESVTGKDGKTRMFVCQTAAIAQARSAMASARAEIARDGSMSASERAEALRSIDEAMKGLDHDS